MALNPNPSNLDQQLIIQRSFDKDNDALRTTSTVVVDAEIVGEVAVEIDAADGDNIAIANSDGSKKVDVSTISGVNALAVDVKNAINTTPSGLSTDIRPQRITVTDVATKIPGTSLAGRNAISVRVWGANIVFFGDNTVTASIGYPKFQYEEIYMDIRDNASVELYGICEAGKTCEVAVLELA